MVGPAVAGVIDQKIGTRISRGNRRLATEASELRHVWAAYAGLTDAEVNAGAGGEHIVALANRLPLGGGRQRRPRTGLSR